jgi:hypothetical protein
VFAVKGDKNDVKADTSAAVVGFNLHFNTLAPRLWGCSKDDTASTITRPDPTGAIAKLRSG